MADQIVQLPVDGVGKKVDVSELTVNAQVVERQRVNLADPTNATSIAAVKAASTAPAAADPALVISVSPNSLKAASTAPVAADLALVVAVSPNSLKAASTAPVAADLALVVCVSPNSLKAASTAAALVDPSLPVALSPNSPIGKVKLRDVAATVVAIKASSGVLFGLQIVNNSAATAFIQIFDLATGGVTLGTTTPDMQVQVAANSTLVVPLPDRGINFATAISVASTTLEKGSVASAAGVQVYAQTV